MPSLTIDILLLKAILFKKFSYNDTSAHQSQKLAVSLGFFVLFCSFFQPQKCTRLL